MDTLEFLRRIWPHGGNYCVETKARKGFRHHWYATIDDAAAGAVDLDAQGHTVYHACASFLTPTTRKAENAQAVRSIWLDIDVGDDPRKYPTLAEAATACKAFFDATGLPQPLIVSSGGGLHCYWSFAVNLDIESAHAVASSVKALAIHHKLKIDHTRTADFASVLRPVGTHNRKFDPAPLVRLVKDAPDYDFVSFAERVAENMQGVEPIGAPAKKRQAKGANAAFEVPVNYPDSDAEKVAEKCAQVRLLRDWRKTHEPMAEPIWYASLQVLHFCKNGDEKIHEWSEGHAAYVREQTDAKIAQITAYGPTTCATFEHRDPDKCRGCPYRGTITSPIQLGAVYDELPPPAAAPATPGNAVGINGSHVDFGDDENDAPLIGFVAPPKPFTRTPQGIVHTNADGITTIVYPYDLYLADLAYDEGGRYEMSLVRHQLPQEGWMEFPFRSSNVAGDRDFEQAMRDNHVKPHNTALLKLYLKLYMQEIQRSKKIRRLYASMGWKDGTDYFVWGEKAFHKDGTVQTVGVSPTVASVAKALRTKGDRQKWIEATRILDMPGMEAHAMAFSAGPGSVLMKFTGFEGALFNAVGASNSGKTSIARFFTSMYGCYDEIKLRSQDTINAKIGRIGILSSLPVYVDEVTNEDPEVVSDFVYEITQGRSKLRLRQDGTEREPAFWSTIVVSSSNTSLSAKLGLAKANPEAERLRLFEFPIERQESFVGDPARLLFRTTTENYGHAGPEFIQYVVTHQDEVRAGLDATMAALRLRSEAREEERMWIASVACGLYGLALMKKLGLVEIDVSRVAKWALTQLGEARLDLDDARVSSVQLLGQYLNDNAGYRLSVRSLGFTTNGAEDWQIEKAPMGAMYMRYEVNSNRIWIQSSHLHRYIVERQGDWRAFEKDLAECGALVRRTRKTLGKGTNVVSSQVKCLEFNTSSPEMADFVNVMQVKDAASAHPEVNAAFAVK